VTDTESSTVSSANLFI